MAALVRNGSLRGLSLKQPKATAPMPVERRVHRPCGIDTAVLGGEYKFVDGGLHHAAMGTPTPATEAALETALGLCPRAARRCDSRLEYEGERTETVRHQ